MNFITFRSKVFLISPHIAREEHDSTMNKLELLLNLYKTEIIKTLILTHCMIVQQRLEGC